MEQFVTADLPVVDGRERFNVDLSTPVQSRLSRAWLIVLPVFLTEATYPATPTMTVPLTPMTAAVKAGSMPGAYAHATQHSARRLIIRRSGV
jgi:hypothetical protein